MSESNKTVRKQVDWERIELDFRAGVMSLREMANNNGITHGAINKRAKRDGWERDLKESIKAVVLKEEDDPMEKQGFLYIVYLDDSAGERFYKIGMAWAFTPRFQAHQCASPFDVCVACAYYVGNMRAEERHLHSIFSEKRVRGEWFKLSKDDLSMIARRSLLI